jgi:putative flippase GtrA
MPNTSGLIWRFVANGLAATIVHYSALTTFIELFHVPSAGVANGLASVFGIASSYLGSKLFVFTSSTAVARTLPLFLVVYSAVATLHMTVLAVWSDVWHLPYPVGFLLATTCSMALTFFANRLIVFAHPKK